MDRALLDTDTFSEIIKARSQNVLRSASAYRREHGRYTISVVTISELVKGLHKRALDERIRGLLAAVTSEELLTLDLDAAVIAGRIYGELEKTGQTIGRIDPLIAGTAIAHDLVLVTGNMKHFERIVSLGFPLKLLDWRVP
jgi:predicted nucleic acid-binding protein